MGTASTSSSGEIFLRYPALTAALFHALVYAALSFSRAEKELRDLRKAGVIDSHPLVGNQVYYSLTQKGGRAYGLKKVKPLGAHAIMRSVAIAAFEVKTGTVPKTKEQTETTLAPTFFGGAWPNNIPSTLCYTREEAEQIAFCCLIIDYGKNIRRLHKQIERYHRTLVTYSVTRELLQAGCYRFVVLTGHETKAHTIRKLRLDYPIDVIVIPQLGDLHIG